MARQTDYNEIIVKLANQYFNLPRTLEDEEIIPTIEGLALYIDVSRSTIYEWVKDEEKKEFSDIVERILEKQAQSLVNNGLKGKFTPTIAKVLLTKHGYREGIDATSDDKPIGEQSPESKAKALAFEEWYKNQISKE